MKSFIVIALLISATAQAIVPELASKLAGAYVAEGNCDYDRAEVKIERDNYMDYIVVRLQNPALEKFKSRAVNMDNMWTKVRTTRGIQRIITQDRISGNSVLAEEKICLPGWVGCSGWNTALSATLTDEDTMEVVMDTVECTFKKVRL